ncbi:hypothetical protein V1527DRAFT_478460 [Lipomyces starkeyi]
MVRPTELNATHLTLEQQTDYERRMQYIGLAKGAAFGTGIGLGINYLTKVRFPVVYKSVTLRMAAVMLPVIGLSGAWADHELSHAIHIERSLYQREKEEQSEFSKFSPGEKLRYLAFKHRLSLIFGTWLASLGICGYIVSRDKLMTRSQKVVQARMYAQGLTLLLVVATTVNTVTNLNQPQYIPDPNDKHHRLIPNPSAGHHRNHAKEHWKSVLDKSQDGK